MRKVKVHKETYLVLRKLKVEEERQVPDILTDAVDNYAKNRKRRLAKLAKKALKALKSTKKEDPPKVEDNGGSGPDVEKETSPEGGDEQPPE